MWQGLGVDYEGGILDAPSRVAIHFTHRLGALVTFLFLFGITLTTWRSNSNAQREPSRNDPAAAPGQPRYQRGLV